MLVKEKIFLLKKTRYGDADLILQALTPRGARISLFARSALKSRKRFGGGVLEPTHYVLALFDEKKHGQGNRDGSLSTLREASLIEDFQGIRSEYARLETALRFVQLVSDVSREGDVGSHELYNLLGNALRAAETTDALDKLQVHFTAKLLAIQGLLPHDRDESILLRASIAEHRTAGLLESEWRETGVRVQRALREFLSHLPDRG